MCKRAGNKNFTVTNCYGCCKGLPILCSSAQERQIVLILCEFFDSLFCQQSSASRIRIIGQIVKELWLLETIVPPAERCDTTQDGLGDDGSKNKIKLKNMHQVHQI